MDKPIVVKIGGSTFGSHDTTLEDLVALQKEGKAMVVVHGGGNLITRWLSKQGVAAKIEDGLRVTDEATIEVVAAVLCGLVNKDLVAGIQSLGGRAIGLSGVDGGLMEAEVRDEKLGYVGEVVRINPQPVEMLLNEGFLPVIAPLALSADGQKLNVNADTAAGELAAGLDASRLILLTDVPGVMDRSHKVYARMPASDVAALVSSGVVVGGMIPKVKACLCALSSVAMAQIVDGREPHALVQALAGKAAGTTII